MGLEDAAGTLQGRGRCESHGRRVSDGSVSGVCMRANTGFFLRVQVCLNDRSSVHTHTCTSVHLGKTHQEVPGLKVVFQNEGHSEGSRCGSHSDPQGRECLDLGGRSHQQGGGGGGAWRRETEATLNS